MIKTFNPVPDEVQETLDCLTDGSRSKDEVVNKLWTLTSRH